MDTPRIALRFRDASPGIDTISEHRDVARREGAVWWGWWKKEFEPNHVDDLRNAAEDLQAVYLIDRSTERAFRAEVLRVQLSTADIDQERVPAYYWSQRDDVAAWFLLRTIEGSEYPADVATGLGERTLAFLDVPPLAGPEPHQVASVRSEKRSILHISDLHFGDDHAFLPPREAQRFGEAVYHLHRCVVTDLERTGYKADVAAIVASGDFTTGGDWSDATRQSILVEIGRLREVLGVRSNDVVALPGNHDVIRYPEGEPVDVTALAIANQTSYKHEREYRTFVEELTGRSWKEPLNYYKVIQLPECDVVVCALNSCTIAATRWTEYGYVGTSGLDVLREVASLPVSRPTFKVLCLHHHLVPVTTIECPSSRGVSLTLDAVQVLAAAQRAGIDLVLHGHQHQANIAEYKRWLMAEEFETKPLLIVSGGSVGARNDRLPGAERNTYAVLTFHENDAHLVLRELRSDGKPGMQMFSGPLGLRPATP